MANAKKCDRCGVYYQEVDQSCMEELASVFAMIATPYNIQKQISVIEKALDLCPSCSKSLKRWARCSEDEDDGN